MNQKKIEEEKKEEIENKHNNENINTNNNISKNKDIESIDLNLLTEDNPYKSTILCFKRAEQIYEMQNMQRRDKLNDWLNYSQNLNNTTFNNNAPQQISEYCEKIEKATNIAIKEFKRGELKETTLFTYLNKNELNNIIKDENNNTCTICLNDYTQTDKVLRLKCKHYFHEKCIQEWLKQHNTCQLCRKRIR